MARRKRSKRWVSWLFFIVLLIVAGCVIYFVWDSYFNDEEDDSLNNNATDTEVIIDDSEKTVDVESSETDGLVEEGTEKEKVPQYDGSDPNSAEELSGAITYAGVQDGVLMIRMNIDQYLNSGECELTLKKAGATIYSSIAKIIGSASTSTCEGFDVPIGGLGGGKIEININLKADSKKGTIRGEVDV